MNRVAQMAPEQQRGMALVVGLILLLMITLVTIVSFNIGKNSMEIVGNMQHRDEVIAAANDTIQEAISTTLFFNNPTAPLLNPCASGANTKCYDTNGDGTDDVTVTLATPTCIQAQIIPNSALDYNNDVDRSCYTGTPPGSAGLGGVAVGDSSCGNSLWELKADAEDTTTGAKVTVTEGAAVRVSKDVINASCS